MIKFNVTSTSEKTQIISSDFTGSNQIDYITFNTPDNSDKYAFATSYTFTIAGERIGYIHFKPNCTSLINLFSRVTALTYVDLNNLDTRAVTSMTGMCTGATELIQCLMSNCRADSLKSMINMFNSCNNLKYVDFGSYISGNFKPRKLTDIRNMFNYCTSITSINMSMFDLSTVSLFGYTWGNCTSLVELYISTGFSSDATMTSTMFANNTKYGKLYYNSAYNISKLTALIPSTWQAVGYNY